MMRERERRNGGREERYVKEGRKKGRWRGRRKEERKEERSRILAGYGIY